MTLLVLALMAQLQKPQPKPETPPGPVKLALKVGEQKPSPVPMFATGVLCDDRTIVEVLDLGDHLEFKGLAAGKTLCALGRGKSAPLVIEISVER